MSMQMDAYLKEEQIGTLFVLVGSPEGGFWGGGGGRGVHPKKYTCLPKKNSLLGCSIFWGNIGNNK